MKSIVTSPSSPLREAELAELDELLEAADRDSAMMLEEVDGLCAALACVPGDTTDEAWQSLAMGCERDQARARLGEARLQRLLNLLGQHRRSVAQRLQESGHFRAAIGRDPSGHALADAWAIGFLRGIELNEDAWADVQDDERYAEIFELLYRFALEGADPQAIQGSDGDDTPNVDPIAEDEREALVDDMLDGVSELFEALAVTRGQANNRLQPRR